MTQEERLDFLIDAFLKEQKRYQSLTVPSEPEEKKNLLRSLMNVRPPLPLSAEVRRVQDAWLMEETAAKGIVDVKDLTPVQEDIYLWQGDITTLKCGAIVNAANSALLGCFIPCHSCIDNVIHTYAGVQLRLACSGLMRRQGHEEPVGDAKITPGFNLPCNYIIHTVGPYITEQVYDYDRTQLSSCYSSCLSLAAQKRIPSVAFCCISTGEFHFPNEEAARIAVRTVKTWLSENHHKLKVIFDVYKDLDFDIYRRLLGCPAGDV